MKRKIISLLICTFLILSIMPTMAFAQGTPDVWDGSVATAFAGGTGTEDDPYQIATGAQLAYLASIVNSGDDCENKYYSLNADIDLNNVGWTPIGNTFANALLGASPAYCFAGVFDGNYHTISNLSIGTNSSPLMADVCGLFGASVGTLKNVSLNSVSINCVVSKTSGYVIGMIGSIAGYTSGTISNCAVTDLVMSTDVPSDGFVLANWIGGFVGTLDGNSSISNCSVSGSINDASGEGSIGGFIGELGKASSIAYCGADVSVTSVSNSNAAVGGFVGQGNTETDPATLINHCYATGNVSGGGYAGGFVGNLAGLNIKNCYAKGNVSNANYGASFAGSDGAAAAYYGTVENCYTTGMVSDIKVDTYAFFPQTEMVRSPIVNCYYNSDSTPGANETAVGKLLSEMQESSFAATLNNGDEANGWIIRADGTPYSGAEPADYSGVNKAVTKIPADLSVYTDATVQALNDAKDAVVTGKNITEQTMVDDYATAIEDAVTALVYKDADYSKVDAAITKIPTDLSGYTDATVKALNDAKNAVVTGKNITEQTTVDGYASAIENAIKGLTKKPATTSPDTNSPQTGDTSNMALWIVLLFVSGSILTVLVTFKKRKQAR